MPPRVTKSKTQRRKTLLFCVGGLLFFTQLVIIKHSETKQKVQCPCIRRCLQHGGPNPAGLYSQEESMKIAICDDNPQYVQQHTKKINAMAQRHGLAITIDQYANGEQLLFAQEDAATRADIIFLDIRMPGRDGVNVAHALREMKQDGEIIFFTHSTDNMLDAFDVDALHYIVKEQTSDEKIEEIFLRAIHRAEQKHQETIVLTCAGESRSVPVSQILYFESIRHVIHVHYASEIFEFYSTLGKLEELLFGHGFVRIHRSFLVSLRHAASLASYTLTLTNGEQLPVAKGNYRELKEKMTPAPAAELL